MPHPSALRGLSFLTLLIGAVLTAAVVPRGAAATSPSPGPFSNAPADGTHDYPPPQSRQPASAQERIGADNFSEPLLVAAIFQETNQQRANLGLPAFLPDEKAARAARQHARWMAGTHRLSHDEPSSQGASLTSLDRLFQQGLRPHFAAENIAFNLVPDIIPGRLFYTRLVEGRPVYSYQSDGPALRAHTYENFARVILTQWMHSPPHRAHLADPELHFLGVGVALAHRRKHPDTIYVAEDFFTPHLSPAASGSVTNLTGATQILLRP